MFCSSCGSPVAEDSLFCGRCGQKTAKQPSAESAPPVQQIPPKVPAASPVQQTPPEVPAAPPVQQTPPEVPAASPVQQTPPEVLEQAMPLPAEGKPKSSRKLVFWLCAIPIILGLLAGGYFGLRWGLDTMDYQKLLSEAEDAAADGDYARAADLYRQALSLRPDDEAVQDALQKTQSDILRDGLVEAKALAAEGKIEDALRHLENLPLSDGDSSYGEIEEHLVLLRSVPTQSTASLSAFPEVSVRIPACPEDAVIRLVQDNSAPVSGYSQTREGDTVIVTYTVTDGLTGGTAHRVTIHLEMGAFVCPVVYEYSVPDVVTLPDTVEDTDPDTVPVPAEPNVQLELVSTDFSDYPKVHAYFRIVDINTGGPVDNIRPEWFTIEEKLSGGSFLAREVKTADSMIGAGQQHGIHIALVADKSGSISSDMPDIKRVMSEFINSISFEHGDMAELIAFDDVPQVMCTFTNKSEWLLNGIDSMEVDGQTAFYDAIYQGIRGAALQGGARCVIAFTDGEDNRSVLTPSEIIEFAKAKQVPLYIIGVGGYNHDTLRTMASETGGEYWHINDLNDLTLKYAQVYKGFQDMYVVTYESDLTANTIDERALKILLTGSGYKGETTETFTPSETVTADATGPRYEVFLEDVTWEEANEKCRQRGGHLVTVTSKEEEEIVIKLAKDKGAEFVWLGGYTTKSNSGVFAHWVTGEPFTYENWKDGEPSRQDADGVPEWYLMLWYLKQDKGWSWNDQRNALTDDFPVYRGKLAYVCEYENRVEIP